ncbi:hypothetical protein DTO027B5_5018 [Paecilomyces variotii]|nr:hypothetical protein DTO027B3_3652 [Paecilomyces variotii]KAJ9333284.1 hypothetical protein DTO027B5_5018 [Paecilomyces variotii]
MSAIISNYLVLSLSCSFQSEIRNGRRVTEPRPVEVAVLIAISGRVAHPETEVRQVLSVASRYQFEATDF